MINISDIEDKLDLLISQVYRYILYLDFVIIFNILKKKFFLDRIEKTDVLIKSIKPYIFNYHNNILGILMIRFHISNITWLPILIHKLIFKLLLKLLLFNNIKQINYCLKGL